MLHISSPRTRIRKESLSPWTLQTMALPTLGPQFVPQEQKPLVMRKCPVLPPGSSWPLLLAPVTCPAWLLTYGPVKAQASSSELRLMNLLITGSLIHPTYDNVRSSVCSEQQERIRKETAPGGSLYFSFPVDLYSRSKRGTKEHNWLI